MLLSLFAIFLLLMTIIVVVFCVTLKSSLSSTVSVTPLPPPSSTVSSSVRKAILHNNLTYTGYNNLTNTDTRLRHIIRHKENSKPVSASAMILDTDDAASPNLALSNAASSVIEYEDEGSVTEQNTLGLNALLRSHHEANVKQKLQDENELHQDLQTDEPEETTILEGTDL